MTIADQGSSPDPRSGPDDTLLVPGFTGIGNVQQVNSNNAGWTVHGPMEQSRAGWLGDGDPLLRVLLIQLTVSSTSNVRGTMAVHGVNQSPGGPQAFIAISQTFNSIPGPGGLMLGLLACVVHRQRTRV